jgi:hypothetical protein
MTTRTFQILVGLTALAFAIIFAVIVMPALIADGDPVAGALAGFVNPYASGYAWDAILCWVILTIWILYERRALGVPKGWICILLGLVPGVAVGFGLYLILRTRHLKTKAL